MLVLLTWNLVKQLSFGVLYTTDGDSIRISYISLGESDRYEYWRYLVYILDLEVQQNRYVKSFE